MPDAPVPAALAAEIERTRARIAYLTREMNEVIESTDLTSQDDEHDPEGATVAFERAQVTSLLREAEVELAELHLAEERVRAGTYGVCERCGRAIADERLDARPAARTCVSCA